MGIVRLRRAQLPVFVPARISCHRQPPGLELRLHTTMADRMSSLRFWLEAGAGMRWRRWEPVSEAEKQRANGHNQSGQQLTTVASEEEEGGLVRCGHRTDQLWQGRMLTCLSFPTNKKLKFINMSRGLIHIGRWVADTLLITGITTVRI